MKLSIWWPTYGNSIRMGGATSFPYLRVSKVCLMQPRKLVAPRPEGAGLVVNLFLPVPTKPWELWNSCSRTPKYSRPRKVNRVLLTVYWGKAHRVGQRTLRFPKSATAPAPPYGDQFCSKPYYTWCLYPTLCDHPSTLIRARAESYAPDGQSPQSSPSRSNNK